MGRRGRQTWHGVPGGGSYRNAANLQGGGDIGTQRPSAWTSYAADGAFSWENGPHEFLFAVQYLQQPKTPRYDELVAGFGQTQPSSAVFFFEPNDRLFLHGRYRVQHPLFFVDRAELHVAFQQINDDRRTRDFGSTLEFRERNRSDLLGVTLQMTSEWPKWITVTYGGEIYLDKIHSHRTGHDTNTGVTTDIQSRFADGSTLNSYAGYLQTELQLHPRLSVLAGGRLSYFDEHIPSADRGVGVDLSLVPVTGNLGLLYRLTPEIHLVSNVGRGFRVPNVFDLSTLGPRPGNRFNIPNPNLSAEKVLTFDGGVKLATFRFTGEAFGFYSILSDKISAQSTGNLTPEGRQIVQSENSNRVKIWGLEFGGKLQLTDQWQATGSVAYLYGEEKFPDGKKGPADRIPPLNGRIGAIYQSSHGFWFEPFLRFAAQQNRLSDENRNDPRINPNGTPGWVTMNVRTGWTISPRWQARLAMENVLNQPYREHGSGIDAPGFNVVASVEAKF